MQRNRLLLLIHLALATIATQTPAADGINKCRDRDGRLIYTDAPCEDLKARRVKMKPAHINTLPRSAFVGSGAQTAPKSALDVVDFSRLPIPGLPSSVPPATDLPTSTPTGTSHQTGPNSSKPPETPWYRVIQNLF